MPETSAPAEESLNPYEAYYLEQAAMLASPDEPGAPHGIHRDFASFRLAPSPLWGNAEERPGLTRRDRVVAVLGVVILMVIPLAIAALYWRSCTIGA